MFGSKQVSILIAALGAAVALGAGAGHVAAGPADPLPLAGAATTIGEAPAPWGWGDFCRKFRAECGRPMTVEREVGLTGQTWARLVAINDLVNTTTEPVTDLEHWGIPESWDLPTDGKGDCEDYALLKRKLLAEAGFPRGALLVTVVTDRRGEGHAVLTVKTSRGDFVLDNQETRILAWNATGYRFVKRQSAEDPNRWVWLGQARAPALTSSR